MIKKFLFFLIFLCFAAVTAAGFGAYALYYLIVLHPGPEIEAHNIQAILGQESPVFYNDNTTKLGVFFDEAHRQYVKYADIPVEFVNALVAAEDNQFFSHFGFDILGIGRAMVKNIEAGRIVQGGSTLTQQTAKNLFKRSERSFKEKLKELLFALRLEYHYSKEEIFEFYANQFYVSGNGHGLGVAARHYFDKEASDLNLVECAFIAGSVKRPNYYNPFFQKNEEAVQLAKVRAKERLNYVLDKMLELGMIDRDVYEEAVAADIEFKQGQVGYQLDYVMEVVKDAVSSDEVLAELEKNGIDNISTSGVRIITTVDKIVQDQAVYALRHDLSRLDTELKGYEHDEVQSEYAAITFPGDEKLEPRAFLFGTVQEVTGKGKETRINVDFGSKIGSGVIEGDSLMRLAEARAKWRKNKWAKAGAKELQSLAEQIVSGDRIWVSVKEVVEEGSALLELEKYPEIEGGAIVVQDGTVKAMAGGVENRFFNRAIQARRTMGSSFKPFVYAAALQLGWNSSDLLKNSRDMFVYHRQPYFPRPDHKSPFNDVSMSWAGTKSENVASVWLVAHLCDQLNSVQFRDLAEHLDLTPRVVNGETEAYRAYRARIRDEYGILITNDTLKEAAFRAAVRTSETDFMFEDLMDDYRFLRSINYGLNVDRYRKMLDQEVASLSGSSANERNELQTRKSLLYMNYLALKAMRQRLKSFAEWIDGSSFFTDQQDGGQNVSGELFYDYETGRYVFQPGRVTNPNLEVVYRSQLEEHLYTLSSFERERFWGSVQLYGVVSVAGFDLLSEQIEQEYQRLERELPYSFDVLADVSDFRIFAGLKYLIALAREMGIASGMQPVLSFPLGSNVVSLLETTRMYEGLVTGIVTTYGNDPENKDRDSLLFIDRIESADGQILYQPEQQAKTVLGPKARIAVGHILENVVKFGTGRQADKGVKLSSEEGGPLDKLNISVPVLGKTGTANDYTNAAFLGYLPAPAEDGSGLVLRNGYAVGVYVGYDDNVSMRKSTIKISGAAGALPTWIEIVNTLIREDDFVGKLDPAEISFNGLQLNRDDKGQLNLIADQEQGGIVTSPAREASLGNRYQPSILTFGTLTAGGGFTPDRSYQPFWRAAEGP
ncbi:transglycosylase domain-containing protein [Desulfopila aestuarii]|uniref:Penicillin binding protein transpeptidase domain-containing protein n=1 Tax=Desulfopila aestuarii DSM 18488 TaxID=1121416 RepID=A0A1M7Y8G8_9BACT|nr:transglycosylase domain-containing protein [Desulfopila aestuarii]SHO48917.1 Penicillin binding protein transpeptidase domain-containing protein [Desulfopila aestuarii DSM 18488]